MIEAMVDMGNKILQGKSKKDSMIKTLALKTKKDEMRQVVKLNFNLNENRLDVDVKEEMDEDTVKKYLYFGRKGGPNAAQWYATYNSLTVLVSEVVTELAAQLSPGDLKDQLAIIGQAFFRDFGEGLSIKDRYLLDLHRFGYLEKPLDQMLEAILNEKEAKPYKILTDEVVKAFQKDIQEKTGCKKDCMGLFTLLINGKPIAEHPEYIKLIDASLGESEQETPQKKKAKNALECTLCGNKDAKKYHAKDIDFSIKYFTTNQLCFASKMNKNNYDKNFVLCSDCYDRITAAENYLTTHLKCRLAGFDVYLLPHYLFGDVSDIDQDDLFSKIIETFNASKAIGHYNTYQEAIEETLYDEGPEVHYLINLLFYRKTNQATKIIKMIKDIEPIIFMKMGEAVQAGLQWQEKYFKIENKNRLGFNQVYYNTPIKITKGEPVSYRHVLNLYEAVFLLQKLPKKRIVVDLAECLKIRWFGREGYNIKVEPGPKYLEHYILRQMQYIIIMEHYGMIERSEGMDVSVLALDDVIKDYIEEMGYSEEQATLFLLGCLVGEAGKKQNQNNGNEGTYKPILNKINFNGMDKVKLVRLSNTIPEKLRQLKILQYNEKLYAAHKNLLDKHINHWTLNKEEGLFYLMSGYSFKTVYKKEKKLEEE